MTSEKTMTIEENAKLRLRPLALADTDNAIDLLVEGFPRRNPQYWRNALERLWSLDRALEVPHPGYVIDVGGKVVGIILVVASDVQSRGRSPRANLSSWYVKPDYRSFATLLLSRACKEKSVTYLNISAAKHTHKICEALGFKRYSQGQFLGMPVLTRPDKRSVIEEFDGASPLLDAETQTMMSDHVGYGCICLLGKREGAVEPFILVKRRVKGMLPMAQLVYCNSNAVYASFAGAIGRYLARRGIMFVIMDGSGQDTGHHTGLWGRYFPEKTPKMFKGPDAPRQNDLAYSEIAVFGI